MVVVLVVDSGVVGINVRDKSENIRTSVDVVVIVVVALHIDKKRSYRRYSRKKRGPFVVEVVVLVVAVVVGLKGIPQSKKMH